DAASDRTTPTKATASLARSAPMRPEPMMPRPISRAALAMLPVQFDATVGSGPDFHPLAQVSIGKGARLLAPGRRQPRKGGATRALEAVDRILVREGRVDIVDAAHQPVLAQGADLESVGRAVGRDHDLARQVDGHLGAGRRSQLSP